MRLASQEHSWFTCNQCFMQSSLPYARLVEWGSLAQEQLFYIDCFLKEALAPFLKQKHFGGCRSIPRVVSHWSNFFLVFPLLKKLLRNSLSFFPKWLVLWMQQLRSPKYLQVNWKKPSSFGHGYIKDWFQNIFLLSNKGFVPGKKKKRFALQFATCLNQLLQSPLLWWWNVVIVILLLL